MMKRLLLLALTGLMAQGLMAQVPKSLIGKTFYNSNRWNMNPRYGGIPTITFKSANTAAVKKGDMMMMTNIKKYKNGFISYAKNDVWSTDTFQFTQLLNKKMNLDGYEMTDQSGQVWTTRFSSLSKDQKQLSAFPAAQIGYKRNVIVLPEVKNEDLLKVEIYAGIYYLADCNNYSLLGEIQEKSLKGYGYNYYNVETEERTVGTFKACLDQKKVNKFVFMHPITIAYNSRLPIVVYAPEHVQIRYKIYNTGTDWEFAIPQ